MSNYYEECDVCKKQMLPFLEYCCKKHYVKSDNQAIYRFYHFCSIICEKNHNEEFHYPVDIS